jgi:hypothetical protein
VNYYQAEDVAEENMNESEDNSEFLLALGLPGLLLLGFCG